MWNKVKSFFKFSETIFWARLQVAIGAVFGLITFVEPSLITAVIPLEWVPIWLLISGIATEWLRRRRSNL